MTRNDQRHGRPDTVTRREIDAAGSLLAGGMGWKADEQRAAALARIAARLAVYFAACAVALAIGAVW